MCVALECFCCSYKLVRPLYRKAHSGAAMHWLNMIFATDMPVLVCLTFGDKLFAENMPGHHQHPKADEINAVIQQQMEVS